MTRNTEKRVEVACPIYDEEIKRRLKHCLKVMLSDTLKAREMTQDGSYRKKESRRAADRCTGSVHEGGGQRPAPRGAEKRKRRAAAQSIRPVQETLTIHFTRRKKMDKLTVRQFGMTEKGEKARLYTMKK